MQILRSDDQFVQTLKNARVKVIKETEKQINNIIEPNNSVEDKLADLTILVY